MKSIKHLFNIHENEDIYVIGSGPSLGVFPLEFLDKKITIGLNQTWKFYHNLNYSITLHPDHSFSEDVGIKEFKKIEWIINYEKLDLLTEEQKIFSEENHYYFRVSDEENTALPFQPVNRGRNLDLFKTREPSKILYSWSSISQSAVHLAFLMGAKNIILVGCDCDSFGDIEHARAQHSRWRGARKDVRLNQYKQGLVEIRKEIRNHKVNLISLQPFIGLSGFEEEFHLLSKEINYKPQSSLGDIDKLKIRDWIVWIKSKLIKYKFVQKLNGLRK